MRSFSPFRLFTMLGIAMLFGQMSVATAMAQQTAAPVAAAPATASGSYRPLVGDVLRLTVFGEAELTGDFTVANNGMISLPLIKDVQVLGRTMSEIETEITSRLKPDYLTDPKVSILIASFRPVIVLGEVNKPGSYEFRQGMTLIDVVGLAGGFTYRANERRIVTRRAGQSPDQDKLTPPEAQLTPGDVVTVRQRFF